MTHILVIRRNWSLCSFPFFAPLKKNHSSNVIFFSVSLVTSAWNLLSWLCFSLMIIFKKKNTIQYKPTPMLSAVSWLCIYPLCDRRSSTWPSGQRTVWVNNVFLCKLVQIAPNWHCILWQILQLSLSLCLEIQVARLCTSMCRLRVIRSFPGSPGFTRIFT